MRNQLLFLTTLIILFASCSNREKAFNQYLATADSTSFQSDITDPNSPSRKILHTADLSYRVQDVMKATTQTETWAKQLGGIVDKSEMHNQEVSIKDMPYKSDSLRQIQVYTPQAEMVVKVPVQKMDSFITLLSANAQFVNHRIIAQQDVTYIYLANALKNQQAESNDKPVHYTPPSLNANEILAQKTTEKLKEQGIDRRIDNLQMLEGTNYATLSINFAQPCQVETLVKANIAYAVQTPLSTQFILALSGGASILRDILLAVVQLWPIELIAILLFLLYKRYRKHAVTKTV